jgi:hypothetical protein
MSWDFYTLTEPKARKEYRCDASDFLLNIGLDCQDWTIEEQKAIDDARDQKWKIPKGTKYEKCEGMFEGEFTVFRARPDINAICTNHGFYES